MAYCFIELDKAVICVCLNHKPPLCSSGILSGNITDADAFKESSNPQIFISCNFFMLYFQFYSCCCSVAKLYLTICKPMDCSPPGSSVHGISQVRTLEWLPRVCIQMQLTCLSTRLQKDGKSQPQKTALFWYLLVLSFCEFLILTHIFPLLSLGCSSMFCNLFTFQRLSLYLTSVFKFPFKIFLYFKLPWMSIKKFTGTALTVLALVADIVEESQIAGINVLVWKISSPFKS